MNVVVSRSVDGATHQSCRGKFRMPLPVIPNEIEAPRSVNRIINVLDTSDLELRAVVGR
jgi:hypothetical protein